MQQPINDKHWEIGNIKEATVNLNRFENSSGEDIGITLNEYEDKHLEIVLEYGTVPAKETVDKIKAAEAADVFEVGFTTKDGERVSITPENELSGINVRTGYGVTTVVATLEPHEFGTYERICEKFDEAFAEKELEVERDI